MHKYEVEYEMWNSEHPKHIIQIKIVNAIDIRSAIDIIENDCDLLWMCCYIKSIKEIS